MRLPLLLSVPHAGLAVPPEVASLHRLTPREIAEDGDGGAAEIYWRFEPDVAAFVTTDIARAFVDQNRREDDFSKDGVVKTHTCWDVPIYKRPLAPEVVETLLATYHRPYHTKLHALARGDVRLGVDLHTMAAIAPPVAPDPGAERPLVNLGFGGGTVPRPWVDILAECFWDAFGVPPSINTPFSGGHITRTYAAHIPFMQLELSRTPARTHDEKATAVWAALEAFCVRAPWL